MKIFGVWYGKKILEEIKEVMLKMKYKQNRVELGLCKRDKKKLALCKTN